ncbi:Imm52 family immunity protein [Burkholderia glumae]|uniref:Imm52 family immunity protein n=1 Tax=Burkholderia glumae TaxID=337 RepID=UPI0020CF6B73|nr:Imm52 family immunity protein [Burkholderia glumae]MCQ0031438.1 immunity 52 family protein [Burkholderia glumae]MCQ0035090.1 immunity 52 family protein [Burkholderia glumae]
MDISLQFRDDALSATDFEQILTRIQPVTSAMAEIKPEFAVWYAQGDSLDESLLYPAFENGKPAPALLAVLRERFGPDPLTTFVALWDGNQTQSEGATLACHMGDKFLPDSFEISLYDAAALGEWESVATVVAAAVHSFAPAYVSVAPRRYAERQVFDDKPGVGWMLYLPTTVTTQQVPEARALHPVANADGKRVGTLIVSVIDAVFSMDNPEHVDVANRIEIRLVDQDLLPRYTDI